MKRTLFRIHSWLGISLGLVLATMGATGAMLAYEDELTGLLAPTYTAPGTPASPDLSPDALATRLEARFPGYHVNRIDWTMDRDQSHQVRLVGSPSGAPGGHAAPNRITGRVDRASGAWLPEPAIVRAFATIEHVHRWLALPGKGDGPGRTITFLGALALLGFAMTGLALRWPRTRRQWRKLLVLDLRQRKGRLRVLHRVVGLWLLPLYLVSALTGLWWGSDTYKTGVRLMLVGPTATGDETRHPKSKGKDKAEAEGTPIWHANAAWSALARMPVPAYASARITMAGGGQRVRIEALPRNARHAKQVDLYDFAARDGALLKTEPYKDVPVGQRIVDAVFQIHKGAYFGPFGRAALFVSSLFLPFFAISGLLFWWQRRPRRRKPAQGTRPRARSPIGPASPALSAEKSAGITVG